MSPQDRDERTKALILRACLVVWLLCCIAMGVLAYVRHVQLATNPWAHWQAAAHQAQQLHQQQLAQARHEQGEQQYLAWVQQHCGAEAWWKPLPSGALACTDKRGRATGQLLVGANP